MISKQGDRFEALDSLRGVCALLVAVHHFFLFTINPFDSRLIASFFMFVDFFFVLSGFVIAYNYYDKICNLNMYFIFGIKRIARLWPLHIFTYFLLALIVGILVLSGFSTPYTIGSNATAYDIRKFVLGLLFTNSLGLYAGGWNNPSWSISAEFFSYLFFGAIFLLKKNYRIFGVIFLIFIGCIGVISLSNDYLNMTSRFGVFRCFVGFGSGVLAFLLYRKLNEIITINKFICSIFELSLIALMILLSFFAIDANLNHTAWTYLAPPFFMVCVIIFAFDGGIVSSLLQINYMKFLGKISYSIYLNHYILLIALTSILYVIYKNLYDKSFLVFVHMWGGQYLKFMLQDKLLFCFLIIIYLIMVVMFSSFTYKFIEVNFREKLFQFLKKRFIQ